MAGQRLLQAPGAEVEPLVDADEDVVEASGHGLARLDGARLEPLELILHEGGGGLGAVGDLGGEVVATLAEDGLDLAQPALDGVGESAGVIADAVDEGAAALQHRLLEGVQAPRHGQGQLGAAAEHLGLKA